MIDLTDKAKEQITEIANKDNLPLLIRAGVKGGGCAGYSHSLFFENEEDITETDQIFEFDEIRLIVDMVSMTYMEGTTIDYESGMLASGFKFLNKKYKATCGCGSSFSL